MSKTIKEIDKINVIKECLKDIEGMSLHDPVKAAKMYVVLDVILSKKFKLLKFDKYNKM